MSAPEQPDGTDATLALLEAARGGDELALDELVRRHLPALRAFVRVKSSAALRAREECTDLVQTACRQALANLDDYEWRGAGSFRNWLFSFALHKILNKEQYWSAGKRDRAREISGKDEEGRQLVEGYGTLGVSASRVAIAREEVQRVERAMDGLPDDYREVLVLARIVQLPHAEIAQRLGRSEGAVRVLLSRALARLAGLLSES